MPGQRTDDRQPENDVPDLRAHATRVARLVRILRDPGRPLDRESARRLTAARLGTAATA